LIETSYYEVNGAVTCQRCRVAFDAELRAGTKVGGFARAVTLGLLAAGAGFGVYYAIARLTGMEFSLVAILVGVMVGSAVKRGSSGRGGRRYQILAVFLTYSAIVSSYVPLVIAEARDTAANRAAIDSLPADRPAALSGETPVPDLQKQGARPGMAFALVLAVGLVYAIPFLAGFDNILGLVIIGIGLYAAWNTAARTKLIVNGPYRIGAIAGA
jgi:hypothetical protein